MPLQTRTILQDRYYIIKMIGYGGFGAVYRAWDKRLSRVCALKENFDISTNAQRQFEQEAAIMAGLHHTSLPRVIDHFIIPGQGQYLVMDFVEGDNLGSLLQKRGKPFTEAEIWMWIEQVGGALDYLHNLPKPIIHRDIKPENIIITPNGEAMLVDFGISKVYDPNKATAQGARAITSGYSPPEQYGRGKTDARTDVYAMGATIYHLLTDKLPPDSMDMSAGADNLLPPRQFAPSISPKTEQVIVQAMQLEADKRFPTMQAFLQALQVQPVKTPFMSPVWIGVGIVAIVVMCLFFVFLLNGKTDIGGRIEVADAVTKTIVAMEDKVVSTNTQITITSSTTNTSAFTSTSTEIIPVVSITIQLPVTLVQQSPVAPSPVPVSTLIPVPILVPTLPPSPVPVPTNTPVPPPIDTPIPPPIDTPTPTPTDTPTPTPTNTPTPTPTAIPCLTPLYRYWSVGRQKHYYTRHLGELDGDNEWVLEFHVGCVEPTQYCYAPNTIPLHVLWHNERKKHLFTIQPSEGVSEGFIYMGIAGYVLPAPDNNYNSQPLHRSYSAVQDDHFYTTNRAEIDMNDTHVYEHIEAYTFACP